ncbi:unnamed protein product [Lactuca virosa]|uniref:Uncharacterized protein n=1 Tax=Lactuca virosa TaxID=75947 RepID=A0AAU9MQ88_9ASTR|nr:unnamed protein product [Lactuca virosa]
MWRCGFFCVVSWSKRKVGFIEETIVLPRNPTPNSVNVSNIGMMGRSEVMWGIRRGCIWILERPIYTEKQQKLSSIRPPTFYNQRQIPGHLLHSSTNFLSLLSIYYSCFSLSGFYVTNRVIYAVCNGHKLSGKW